MQIATYWNNPLLIYESYNALEILYADYQQVQQPQFGDVLLLTYKYAGNHVGYHAANFVSGEMLFSKNGGGPTVPFLLQKTEDIIKNYAPTNDKIMSLGWYTPKQK